MMREHSDFCETYSSGWMLHKWLFDTTIEIITHDVSITTLSPSSDANDKYNMFTPRSVTTYLFSVNILYLSFTSDENDNVVIETSRVIILICLVEVNDLNNEYLIYLSLKLYET